MDVIGVETTCATESAGSVQSRLRRPTTARIHIGGTGTKIAAGVPHV